MAETTICPICACPTTDTSGCHPRCLRDDRRYAYTDKAWKRKQATLRKRMERERRRNGEPPATDKRERTCDRFVAVSCVETGETWRSIVEAAEAIGVKYSTMRGSVRNCGKLRKTGMHYEAVV